MALTITLTVFAALYWGAVALAASAVMLQEGNDREEDKKHS